jgi:hypothetical protein
MNDKKIVVSDNETDDDADETIKVIQVDISEDIADAKESNDLPDLEEIEPEFETEPDGEETLEQSVDYKKMDISYLRTLVLTRGLATDTKKLKKADLVKLLSDE